MIGKQHPSDGRAVGGPHGAASPQSGLHRHAQSDTGANPKPSAGKRLGQRTRRRGIGVVAVLVSMFVLSGGMRIAGGYDEARSLVAAAFAADAPAGAPGPGLGANCPPPPAELAEGLRLREERILGREQALMTREGEIRLAEQLVEARLNELAEAEARLSRTIARVDGAAESDLARLASVYENMKPKEAAKLFETMDPAFAAGFLTRLRPETAAAILAGMSSETAYVISLVLAGRNANAPTQ